MLPKVSIIITLYNYEKYIAECLESCLNQDFDRYDIIVVNDGSVDNSERIVKRYPVKLINQPNKGYAAARNRGILESDAPYVVMLDADDKLTPDSLSLRYNEFTPDIDLVHGVCLRWYGGNDTRGYNKKTYVHAQGRMWRKSVYHRFGLYYEPLRSMADKEFVYRLGVHPDSPLKKRVIDVRINKVVALYRKHETQMHRIRKLVRPQMNRNIQKIFKHRMKQLKRDGITSINTKFL